MRKSIIAILSLVAMVACTNDVTVNTQAPVAIGFEDSFVEAKTRGAVDPSITTATIDAFDVWGYMDKISGIVFEQQRVTKSGEVWTYEPLQYWMPNKDYYFHAVAPVDDPNIVIDTNGVNTTGLGKITFTNVEGATDLLYTSKHVETDDTDPYYENASTNNKVSLQFMHLLSKIKFTFTNGFTTENTTLKVKNITITDAPKVGEIYVNTERNNFVWNITQETTTALNFGDVKGGEALAAYESDECANERLTIPADKTRSYTIEFDVELFYGTELGMSVHKVVSLENQKFEIGKNYNITTTINYENIADEALKPIEFDVKEVEDWEEGIYNGNIDDDDTQTPGVDPDEPVEEGYKLYFNNLANWTKVYAHIWANEGEDLGLEASEWPGRELTETEELDGVTYYVFQLPATATGKTVNVVFNDGAGTQTKDLAGVVEGNLFFDNSVEPVAPSEVVLYLQPNANWNVDGARFAAYFFNNGETWVDMTLVEGETNIYAVTVPAGFEDVIFCRMNPGAAANNWNNKWNQTDDLKVPTDGTNLYTVTENTWDKGGGEWSVYAPAAAPTALATPVVTAVAKENTVTLTWEAVENAANYVVTVGTEMPVVVEGTTYTFTGEYETEYTFNVVAVPADEEKFAASEACVATATTEAAPAAAYTTVAEFLALSGDDVIPSDATADVIAAAPRYTLKGTITSVTQTTYGNFYLNDGTGEVLIYGLCSPEGEAKYWAASGAKVGDDIVVKTIRTEYNNAPQGKNATFVELLPGTLAFWSFDATATSFTAAGGDKEIGLAIYNATAEVVATSDNAQFSAAYADGTLTITALENTAAEAIEGNITVTCGDLSQVVAVSQAAASSGDQTAVEAELVFSAANRTTFTTSQQVFEANNIKVTNDKGSSTSNVADYVAPARFYKNSKVTVTAPGNITTIVFDCNSASYATALKDSGLTGTISVSSDKVTVTLDGSSNEYVISSLTGGQVRMDGVTVTYLQ